MKKWKQTLLVICSFGLVLVFAKKMAKKKGSKTNSDLTFSNKIDFNLNDLLLSLGQKENIESVESTLSTLKIKLKDLTKINEENLKKIIKSGILKSNNQLTLVCGDNAKAIASELQKLI